MQRLERSFSLEHESFNNSSKSLKGTIEIGSDRELQKILLVMLANSTKLVEELGEKKGEEGGVEEEERKRLVSGVLPDRPTRRKSTIKRTKPDLNPRESKNEAVSNSLERETVATLPHR
ncbi:hypothetical protein M9H77_03938 [Catharanthus roseus]|uniref:Uncharacterized protein n=1 Tax=Catharanthus roseus TaxID=4058 RepID=A0ACC0CCW1_CATRO|nr:hypothetical protein M9H77_03938 [Catharanthus roseus]